MQITRLENMVNTSLTKYVKDQLKTGYSKKEIKQSLLRQGHSKTDVNTAIKQAKPGIPLAWIAILLVAAVIIVLSILVYIKIQAPEKEILVPKEEIKMPEKEEIPAEEIIEKEEIDLEKIPVPPAEKIPEIKIEETQEFEASMKIEEIKEISLTEPDRAEALCSDLNTKMEKDNCYVQIAGAAAKPALCAKISEQTVRDQCYFNFAVQGRKTCDNIKDEEIKKSCKNFLSLNITMT
ncbi:hypothetical protein GF343_04220 [Candidatus Woesearchaeota archaeon]|nr:hypothetical protein [Candidatus Woesearchaeota archaeon]